MASRHLGSDSATTYGSSILNQETRFSTTYMAIMFIYFNAGVVGSRSRGPRHRPKPPPTITTGCGDGLGRRIDRCGVNRHHWSCKYCLGKPPPHCFHLYHSVLEGSFDLAVHCQQHHTRTLPPCCKSLVPALHSRYVLLHGPLKCMLNSAAVSLMLVCRLGASMALKLLSRCTAVSASTRVTSKPKQN